MKRSKSAAAYQPTKSKKAAMLEHCDAEDIIKEVAADEEHEGLNYLPTLSSKI
jgi:hypothetical protein